MSNDIFKFVQINIMMKKNDHFTLHEFGYCFKLLESKPWYMSLLQKHLCTSNETAQDCF